MLRFGGAGLLIAALALGLAAAPVAPANDTLTLTNGDHLTGTLQHADGGHAVFQSDSAGTVTVAWKDIAGLQTTAAYAVIEKNHTVVEGPLTLDAQGLRAGATAVTLADVDTIVGAEAYRRATSARPIWQGWQGAVTAGLSLVAATQSSQSFTAGLDLRRPRPPLEGLSQHSNTLLSFHDTYGSLQQTGVPTVRTSIVSAGVEQDENLSARLFAFLSTDFEHNYAQGLHLQQTYGGGGGWIVQKSAHSEIDLKADVHYSSQAFLSGPGADFVASTLGEHWQRGFGHLVWTETVSASPAYSQSNAFQAALLSIWALPVWHNWAANISLGDNYLGDPQPGFERNSLQFSTGLQLTLH